MPKNIKKTCISMPRLDYEQALGKVQELRELGHVNMSLSKLIRIALDEIQPSTLHTDDTYDA